MSSSRNPPRPTFQSYLLPTFSFSRKPRERQPSITNIDFSSESPESPSSLGSSPESAGWSPNTTPSSSPPTGTLSTFARLALLPGRRLSVPTFGDKQCADEPSVLRLRRTGADILRCSTCASDIAFVSQIVSKGFTGRHGRAYLISPPPITSESKDDEIRTSQNLVNISVGRAVNRQLATGAHVVADITCRQCDTVLGWKYVDAKEALQRYKIGKFILETKRVVGWKNWEDAISAEDDSCNSATNDVSEETIVFDSEDEDECDELFTGTWDPATVSKRRSMKVANRR